MNCGLEYIKLSFILVALEDSRLPPFLGSTLRGGMGTAMKGKFCKHDFITQCADCTDKQNCKYNNLFLYSNGSDGLKGSDTKPNPFAIKPPLSRREYYKVGDLLCFDLILVGESIVEVREYIEAVKHMASQGLGYQRKPFRLDRVFYNGQVVYSDDGYDISKIQVKRWFHNDKDSLQSVNKLSINFLTPFRLIDNKRLVREISFPLLMRSIFRRVSLLSELYCYKKWDIIYDHYLQKAQKIKTISSDLTWMGLNRYSNRAQQKIDISGLIGRVIYEGDLTTFVPFLQIGSVLNIGKSCTMGLGEFEITTQNSPEKYC